MVIGQVITAGEGNLLRADVDALVNTVNTVGVMGKGIALQFKRAYPEMFRDYEAAANRGDLALGKVHVWETGLLRPRFIINFPTKGHWRARSRLKDIEVGLVDLIRVVQERQISSIAVPPLGCGNGGLDWSDVEPRIMRAFATLPDVDVRIYPPAGAPVAAAMPMNEARPKMTPGRAALIALIDEYSRRAFASPSLIESQKLMYFLQEAGEPLRLRYEKNRYGPYADNLRHVLKDVEGHYLQGYGDGNTPVLEAEPVEVLPGAAEAAREMLEANPKTKQRTQRVLELADGFETPYGLELLASVHRVVNEDGGACIEPDAVVDNVRDWTPRKGRVFTPTHVLRALATLCDRGWVTA
jgi:O-acetyl-ADP-ribose deacetylase (regulator of RNase III)